MLGLELDWCGVGRCAARLDEEELVRHAIDERDRRLPTCATHEPLTLPKRLDDLLQQRSLPGDMRPQCVEGLCMHVEPVESHAGIEIDALPYVTGGYFGAAWVSKNHWRARLLTADVNMPGFMTKKGFRNHHINSYAVVLDYFLKSDLKGWWAGGGLVYWKSRIQTDQQLATAHLKNYLLNGSIGYNFPVNKHIYISPWAGLSLRTGGDKNVPVDNLQYSIRLLNPEASLKIGFYF